MSDDIVALERDLTGLTGLMPKKAAQALQQTGMRTKDEWKKLASGNTMGQQYTATIDYTVEFPGRDEIAVDIGPDIGRYGGKTGRGGLTPGFGIFDDPESTPIGVKPVRARARAEQFADAELDKGIDIALEQSLAETGF